MQSQKSGPPFHQMTFAGSSKLQSRVTRVDQYSQVVTTALFRATKPQKKGSFQSHQTPKETKILLLFYARQCGWFLCLISKIYHYCEEIDNFQFTMVWIIQLTMKKGVEQICYKGGALDSSLFLGMGVCHRKFW